MTRLALVRPGLQSAAFARVAPRLRGGVITAVVDPDAAAAKRFAEELGLSVWATSTEQLHQQHDDAFDAWVAVTPLGWLIATHDNRPLDLKPEAWANNPMVWLWGHAFRFLPSVVE